MSVEYDTQTKQTDQLYDTNPAVRNAVDEAYESRSSLVADLKFLSPFTEQLPDSQAAEIYERIRETERSVAPDLHISSYSNGAAEYDDEVRVIVHPDSQLLLSADHATNPVRKVTQKMGGADHGTAGLAIVLGQDLLGDVILPAGRQTGNANVDFLHPVKNAIGQHLYGKSSFLSMHGMAPGKFLHQFDAAEIHGVLGLGLNPSAKTLEVAHAAVSSIKGLFGLRFTIGNFSKLHSVHPGSPRLQYEDDGSLKTTSLAAKGSGTTTNYVGRVKPSIPAIQVELSRSIRFLPSGIEYRERSARLRGVYMGYLSAVEIARSMAEYDDV